MTELVYFGVKALDYHHNQSPMSVPVQIVRPDIVPPSPPLITTVSPTAQGIAFEWLESSSPDVFKHEFQRKVAGLPGWTVLAEFDKQHPLSGFLDTTASRKRWYQYRLVAEDESGNRGGSRIVKAKPINDGLRDAIANLSGQLVSNSGTAASFVRLEWDYPRDIDLIGFQIYRGYDSTSMFSYRFFPFPFPLPASADYADMAIAPNGNLMHCRFKDFDVAFTDDAISSYSYFYNSSLDQNLAVPPPQGAPAPGSVQSYTVPNPVTSQPNMLKYWVLAKFADGSYSPLAGPVLITL